ncbi:MAG: DUF2332 domain-containing protein [Sphingomonadales bacterium]|nr:DUF2332 domain-containing protein [Sphingomonadales bacterium]MBD3773412.1 DUF2332 domain-containing protein [Paracoccaceae bacterium]
MHIRSVPEAIEWQATHAEEAGAHCTARVIRAVSAALNTDTATARRIAGWQGLALEDAMPLRITGGLHNLLVTGDDRRLEPVYAGLVTDQATVDALVCELFEKWDHRLLPWLDCPPQTNEAGRSASIMAGLLWLSGRLGPNFELNEIGASAGVNTMMDRYRFDLGGVEAGPTDTPMRIAPEWRGDAPPAGEVAIRSIRGCDQAPIDLTDPAQAERLKSYVWPEAHVRMGRIDAAIQLAGERAPDIAKMDAAQFVPAMLAQPQAHGVARVLFHSIVWQYIPEAGRAAITHAMEAAGALATREQPLAWVMLETNRETFKHELRVRYWPGGEDAVLLAEAHPHGAWVEWYGR